MIKVGRSPKAVILSVELSNGAPTKVSLEPQVALNLATALAEAAAMVSWTAAAAETVVPKKEEKVGPKKSNVDSFMDGVTQTIQDAVKNLPLEKKD